MLNSKRDESIKRYLSKVGKLKHASKTFVSRYYIVTYNKDFDLFIRFSDHFNDVALSRGVSIDIIKTSVGFYTLRLVKIGVSYTITEDVVLPYLKSILLLYPELDNTVTSYRRAADNAVKIATKASARADSAEAKLNKRDEYIDMVDSVYEENKILHKQIDDLNSSKKTVDAIKRKFENKNKECEILKGKLTKFKNLFNSI